MHDRHARSWPKHESGEPATYGEFSEACATVWGWDAHFAAYSAPGLGRRLGGDEALRVEPRMVMFVVDVDGPNHQATDEWWAAERAKVEDLFRQRGRGYAYRTKGGYRICYALADEFVLRVAADKRRWSASYLDWLAILRDERGIEGDPACKDAFRCYRLPRVRRDEVDVAPLDEVGTSAALMPWTAPLCPADDPRVVRAPAEIPAAAPPVDEDKVAAAQVALIQAWPTAGRHAASLALCGALAKLGWEDEAVASFVDLVCRGAAELPGRPQLGPEATYEKRLAQARSSAEKVARGEEVAGWGSLELAIGQPEALLAARRALGCGPDADAFALAIKNMNPPLRQQLDAACAEAGGDSDFRALLDEVAEEMGPMLKASDAKSKQPVDANPMGESAMDIFASDDPPPQYLVERLIPKGGVGAISGEPKAAKSWDLMHVGVCVAAGKSVFGKFPVMNPGPVFLFMHEDVKSSVKVRLGAIAADLGLPRSGAWARELHIQPRGRALDVMHDAHLCVIAASVRRCERMIGKKVVLLGLDPLSNIHSGEEDKRDSMVKVMARLHVLEAFLGVTIVLIHHSAKVSADNKGRKRGGQKMRGSSVIHGAVDFGIYESDVRGDGETKFIVRVESEMKALRSAGVFDRHLTIEDAGGNASRATFEWQEPSAGEGPKDLIAERAVAVVEKLMYGPLNTREIQTKLGGNRADVLESCKLACSRGWIRPQYRGQLQSGYEITDAGRAMVTSGGGGGSDDAEPDEPGQSGPPPPPGSALAMLGVNGRA